LSHLFRSSSEIATPENYTIKVATYLPQLSVTKKCRTFYGTRCISANCAHGEYNINKSNNNKTLLELLRLQHRVLHNELHRVSKKNCAKLFLAQVCQMSTKFDNFWHTDSTKDRFM